MMNTGLDRLDLYVLRMLETIGIDLKLVEKDEKYSRGLHGLVSLMSGSLYALTVQYFGWIGIEFWCYLVPAYPT